jgi:hypothetical protein
MLSMLLFMRTNHSDNNSHIATSVKTNMHITLVIGLHINDECMDNCNIRLAPDLVVFIPCAYSCTIYRCR